MESKSTPDTRQKIIEAAGETFSEKGFHKATVREICRKAGVNVALVKYHFGDKLGLYKSVLVYSYEASKRFSEHIIEAAQDKGPEERLHAIIYTMLVRTKASGIPAWYEKVLAKEMQEPTSAFDTLVQISMRPLAENCISIVQELLGRTDRGKDIILCVLSILGQCLHHHFARVPIARIYPEITYGPQDLHDLADHILAFSLAGLRAHKARHPAAQDNPEVASPVHVQDLNIDRNKDSQ